MAYGGPSFQEAYRSVRRMFGLRGAGDLDDPVGFSDIDKDYNLWPNDVAKLCEKVGLEVPIAMVTPIGTHVRELVKKTLAYIEKLENKN